MSASNNPADNDRTKVPSSSRGIDLKSSATSSTSKQMAGDPFVSLGIQPTETRVTVLRTATTTLATELASKQLAEPNAQTESELAQVVTSGYRVLDPRLRGDLHQRAQLGRILPNSLLRASRSFFEARQTAAKLKPNYEIVRRDDARPPINRLLPTTDQWVSIPSETTSKPEIETKVEATPDSVHPFQPPVDSIVPEVPEQDVIAPEAITDSLWFDRFEAEEVVAEFRAHRIRRRRFRRWFRQPAVMTTGIVAVCLLLIWCWGLWNHDPVRFERTRASHSTATIDSESVEASSLVKNTAGDRNVKTQIASPSPTLPRESLSHDLQIKPDPMPIVPIDKPSQVAISESESDIKNEVLNTSSKSLDTKSVASTDAESADRMQAIVAAEMEAIAAEFESSPGDGTSMNPSDVSTQAANAEALAAIPVTSLSNQSTSEQIEDLWRSTNNAQRRFNVDSAATLIDEWQQLASTNAVSTATANRLIAEASWLVDDFETVAQRHGIASPENPTEWTDADAESLVRSWVSARNRIDRTDDLLQMINQANECLDRLMTAHRLIGIDAFLLSGDRILPLIGADESTSRWQALRDCVATLPTRDELARLRDSERGRGLAGRVLCLHLNRWDEGLSLLSESSDRKLSLAAKDELEVRQSNRVGEYRRIGLRWQNVAGQYQGRDRETIQRHAADLQDAPSEMH
ncbi:MAG: hypothetical protein AAF539_05190 [Planctomycetota bacterium]